MNLLNLYLHLLLIDVKQAYKSINRIYLYKILKAFGIPKKLVNLIKMMLQYSMEK
jgi:Reverse transcriptase (RNA-dependent DNA polymerase).